MSREEKMDDKKQKLNDEGKLLYIVNGRNK